MHHVWKWGKRILKWLVATVLTLAITITVVLTVFKDDIINYAIGEINQYLKVRVDVARVDLTFWKTFPNLSIDFEHVFVQGALPEDRESDTLLFSELVRLKFNPIDIWNEEYKVKQIAIKPGTLHLVINEQGLQNFDILKPKEGKSDDAFNLQLQKISVEGMDFTYANKKNGQTYAALINEATLKGDFSADKFTVGTEADFLVKRIQNGLVPFVINQPAQSEVEVIVDKNKNTISLPDGTINLAGLPFHLNFLLDSNNLHLKLDAKDLSLVDIANKLAVKEVEEIGNYEGSGTASFHLKMRSPQKGNTYPLINCQFNIKQGAITEPSRKLKLKNIQVDGTYSTEKGLGNETLELSKIRFNSAGGPFSGNLKIHHFNMPVYTGNANGSIDLAVLDALFKLPKIQSISGILGIQANFQLITETSEFGHQVVMNDGGGQADLKQVNFQLEQDSRQFSGISGHLVLNRHQAALENLAVRLGNSDIQLNGIFEQIDGFLQNKSRLQVDVSADSKKIDLNDFTNKFVTEEQTLSANDELVDWLLPTQIDGNVSLDVGTILLDQHRFTEIHGDMEVGDRTIVINQLRGVNAEAAVSGALQIKESAPQYFDLATSLVSKNIQFKPLFKEWNNFDQQVITADNISGKAEVILDMKAPFKWGDGIIKEKIIAQIQLKVSNGNLRNVSSFKQLTADLKSPKTRMVLKPREVDALQGKLDNIRFETLENTIFISDSKLIIPKMEIKSSALDITAEGTHGFNNKVDYRFAFRLRDLKLKKDESEFGEVIDDETGVRIYVRMYGDLDNPTIEWDQTARKDQARENRQEAKQEALSILKSEFGLFKKDTTIKAYQQKQVQREELLIEFGKDEVLTPEEIKKEKQKKQGKLSKFSEKLKQENDKDKEVEFIVD